MNNPKGTFLIIVLLCGFITGIPVLFAEETIWPDPEWVPAEAADVGMDVSLLEKARDFALTGEGSGFITRHGYLVMQWGDPGHLYDLKSSTKGIGVTALGLALLDNKVGDIHDLALRYHPGLGIPPESNSKTGWLEKITLFHLATQTAGFDKPGGYTELLFEPGTQWSYSDGGPNWLAECLTLLYRQDLETLTFERVFGPIGIARTDLKWRENAYRDPQIGGVMRREFGSGIHANVDAMARIGYLYLRKGRWKDRQILSESFVEAVRKVPPEIQGIPVNRKETYFNASDHYGLLWWNNADGTMKNVPSDTYWTWGLYDSLIIVIPSLDIVASRAGKSIQREQNSHYQSIEPFMEPLALSVKSR